MLDTRGFVPPTVAAKIAAIEPRGRRLGWPAELLFDPNLDDHGRPRGLAATLDPSDVIVGVKRGYITIRKTRLYILRFPRD